MLHSLRGTRKDSFFILSPMNPCVALFCRILTAVYLDFLCFGTPNSSLAGGSCFRHRIDNGNCRDLIPKVANQRACCSHGGYFLNRVLTRQEYLNDQLIFQTGTPNCVDACSESFPPTCEVYHCPTGHVCRVVDGKPGCYCESTCEVSDFTSGLICTAGSRQFKNRCEWKKAQCGPQNEGLDIVPCGDGPKECASSGEYDQLLSYSSHSSEQVQGQPPSKLKRSAGMKGRINQKAWTRIWGDPPIVYELANSTKLLKENKLRCHTGEYCMVRQVDGIPRCLSQSSVSYSADMCGRDNKLAGPFCATDNKTYSNRCELRVEGIRRKLELRIAYHGRCEARATCQSIKCPRPDMVCRMHHRTKQPTCLDCLQLPQDCNALRRSHKVIKTSELDSLWSEGDPNWMRHQTTINWPTVCGSNGITYGNACFLHVINCLSDEFVEMMPSSTCLAGH